MNHPKRDDTTLARTMKALAEMEAAVETPSRVESAVMAQWDADVSRRRSMKVARSRTSRFVRGAATAAGVTLIGGLVWQRSMNGPVAISTPPAAVRGPNAPQAGADQYTTVAVVGGPLMANEPVRVVRMRVARAVLSELGIPSAAQPETVDIDVLVGEDGVARGVRVPIREL